MRTLSGVVVAVIAAGCGTPTAGNVLSLALMMKGRSKVHSYQESGTTRNFARNRGAPTVPSSVPPRDGNGDV
jgi:hypothetical protein